ncbi:Probable trehalose-phosphate phosphatase E [Linum perenne]
MKSHAYVLSQILHAFFFFSSLSLPSFFSISQSPINYKHSNYNEVLKLLLITNMIPIFTNLSILPMANSSWVDSMRTSLPTRSASTSTSSNLLPNALHSFNEILQSFKGKIIVMFLDYDGTLSPIVNNPDEAFMSEKMRDTVRRLAQRFKTSIVSGRCVDKVRTFVKLPELYYAGSHGLDIEGPGDVYQHAPEFLKLMTAVFNDLTKKTQSIPGCRVENNKISVSTHYRCVEDGNEENVKGLVDSVLNEHHDELRLVNGKKVFEIRPKIDWNKGNAVEFLLQSLD